MAKMVSDFDLVYSNLGYWSGKCPAFSEPLSKSECQKVARTGGGSFTTITNDYTMGACSVICGDLDQSKNWRCAGRSPEVRWNTIKKPSSTSGPQSILRNVCKRPCRLGFYKSGKKCLPYGGKCANGVLAPQEERASHNFCGSCNGGYYLGGTVGGNTSECKPYAGSCSDGKLISQRLRTRSNHCGSCNAGYYLKGTYCNAVGSCINGKLVDPSVQVKAHQCGRCNDGYDLTVMSCKARVAGYINGAKGTVGCPTGTQAMTSAECQIAASQHNEKWSNTKSAGLGKPADFPAGCYRTVWGTSSNFGFNTHTTGAATSDRAAVVCRTCGTCPQQDLEWVLNDIASTCPSGARNLLGENECRRGAASLGLNFTADDSKMYSGTMHFSYGTRWAPGPWVCRNNGAKASSPTCTKRVDGSVRFTQCSYVGDQRVCGATTSTAE